MARITKSNLAKKTTLPDLPDSNSLSRCRARRPRVVAAASLPRPPPPFSYRSQSTQTDEPALNNNQGPRVFHSERERVDLILKQLYKHRWKKSKSSKKGKRGGTKAFSIVITFI